MSPLIDMTTPRYRVRTSRHSVVIVGARAAGAATALLLARAGHDVLLVDKATLPSDTTSTHGLARGAVVQLRRWGLLDEVVASGAPPVRSVTFHRYDDDSAPVRLPVADKAGVDALLAPRRHVLDEILLRAAVEAGATVWDRTIVRRLVHDTTGRVVGVDAIDADARRHRILADLVVGADGVRSRVAGLVDAPVLQEHAPSGACLYAYVGDVPWEGYEFHLGAGVFAGVFPTHEGQASVWMVRPTPLARPLLRSGSARLDVWRRTLVDLVPGLGHRVAAGSVDGPLRGAVGLRSYVRRAVGPGWALVGDAGYHRDPITGHGMTDAFRDAELLATAADDALREPRARQLPLLEDYQSRRDAALAPTLRLTAAMSAFPAPSRFVELQHELSAVLEQEARELAALPRLPFAAGLSANRRASA
jgi:2-polyprenyl-6-methoxyphenol hydroxylase-like FAD-dependent oxidoreductase